MWLENGPREPAMTKVTIHRAMANRDVRFGTQLAQAALSNDGGLSMNRRRTRQAHQNDQ